MSKYRIAILASGTGSNAVKIMQYLKDRTDVSFQVLSNKADAKVLESAAAMGVPASYYSRKDFYENGAVLQHLQDWGADLVVLAGFLWLVPADILTAFPDRVINIHPALLPKYGGKGMYGMHVHEAVVAAAEPYSGITIHYCNQQYDEGRFILQATCDLAAQDTPAEVSQKVLKLEHFYFPRVIERFVDEHFASKH